jgi:hypothetical protein
MRHRSRRQLGLLCALSGTLAALMILKGYSFTVLAKRRPTVNGASTYMLSAFRSYKAAVLQRSIRTARGLSLTESPYSPNGPGLGPIHNAGPGPGP